MYSFVGLSFSSPLKIVLDIFSFLIAGFYSNSKNKIIPTKNMFSKMYRLGKIKCDPDFFKWEVFVG